MEKEENLSLIDRLEVKVCFLVDDDFLSAHHFTGAVQALSPFTLQIYLRTYVWGEETALGVKRLSHNAVAANLEMQLS